MKAVILAGDRGTRLSQEIVRRLEPMVEIGGKPILWHSDALCVTYGDVGVTETIAFHRNHGKLAAMTAIHHVTASVG